MRIEHKGHEQFLKGAFGNGGAHLFVDANALHASAGTIYMQSQVAFRAPGLVNSLRLTSVTIECE